MHSKMMSLIKCGTGGKSLALCKMFVMTMVSSRLATMRARQMEKNTSAEKAQTLLTKIVPV